MQETRRRPPAWEKALRARLPGWLRLHLRLILAIAVAAAVFALAPIPRASMRYLVAFDAGVAVWLALAVALVLRCDAAEVRRRAEGDDEGAWIALVVAVLATASSLVAVVLGAAAPPDATRSAHIALGVSTLLASWLFLHTLFAFHYAREYYDPDIPDAAPPLGFPGGSRPDYWDFLYFAFNLGTSAQTSDVTVNSQRLRRFVLGHQVASYLFNTAVIALGVNVAASLM